jgi:hypothetical protein
MLISGLVFIVFAIIGLWISRELRLINDWKKTELGEGNLNVVIVMSWALLVMGIVVSVISLGAIIFRY